MGVSQPSLSAQLGRIEVALGGKVFERSREGAKPTEIGVLAIGRARSILKAVELLVHEAKQAAGSQVELRIASNRTPFFASLIVELEMQLPERRIAPSVTMSSTVIVERMLAGEYDVAVVGQHAGFDDEVPRGLEHFVIVPSEPFLIALSESHAEAGLDAISFDSMLDEPWLLPPGRPDGTFAALHEAFAFRGATINAPYGRQSLIDYWPYIAAGNAVALTLPTYDPPPGVAVLPLIGNPIVGRRILLWNPERLSREDAVICARSAAAVYEAHLAVATSRLCWWGTATEHHPRIATQFC